MKKLLALIAASIATSLFLYALVSKDQPARHSGLRAIEMTPLIAIHELYGAPHDIQDKQPLISTSKISWKGTTDFFRKPTAQLTLPEIESDSSPLPTVILLNTGQAAGTGPDNTRTIRLLANRGYAVLFIDCGDFPGIDEIAIDNAPRFSAGCSGTSIANQARTLIDQGIADPAAMAIIGSGVGGYMALMAMSREPGLFKAAIVHSLVHGQTNRFSQDRLSMKPQQAAIKHDLNPIKFAPRTTDQPDRLPIDLLGHIQVAVLISHGKADTVVEIDQAKAIARGLSDAGMNIEFVAFDHEDHSYSRWQTHAQIARLTEHFLARHLGGRDGGYDYIELLTKVF